MPRFAKLRIAALEDLAKQLRFAPVETLRRQLERAEELAGEIEAGRNYPEDWIVFRITGYRPEIGAPAMFVGEALLGDVSALVERMSAAAGVREEELEKGKWLDVAGVCGRWGVSRKTVERWRREGLVARRVKGENGKPRLVFAAAVVERFEKGRGARMGEAAGYSRIEEKVTARMLRRAAVYARMGCSLNQAARRIAKRYGRAHETVRQLLKKHEARGGAVKFGERGPADEREKELMARAHWLGIEPAEVSKRLKRSVASVRRVVDDERAERLRVMAGVAGWGEVESEPSNTAAKHHTGGGTRGRGDGAARGAVSGAKADVLKAEPVMSGLGGAGERDLLRFVESAREGGVILGVVERARTEGYRMLVARARGKISLLARHGAGAMELDEIETNLRWAARLKAELVRSQLPHLVRVFESALERKLEEVRAGLLAPMVGNGIAAIGEAVDAFEPERGGRLAAPAGIGLNRVAAKFVREHEGELGGVGGRAGRAKAVGRLSAGVMIEDWTRRVSAWQRFGAGVAGACGGGEAGTGELERAGKGAAGDEVWMGAAAGDDGGGGATDEADGDEGGAGGAGGVAEELVIARQASVSMWVFHRGALGDSVLLWPRLRAWVRGGEQVLLVTDRAKARLAEREVGVEGVDAEAGRFNALWREGAEVERVEGVTRVVDYVSGGVGVFAANLRRMFVGAKVERERPPRGGREAREFEARHPLSRVELKQNEGGPVVVHVGAGSEAKRWGMERWREVAGELRDGEMERQSERGVIVIAGEVERERLSAGERAVFEGMGGRFVDDVMELAEVVRGARVFVGCDSGPTHLAAQLGVRTVVLFGPTDPGEWAPVGPGVRVVAPQNVCGMEWLTPKQVAHAVSGSR